MKTKKIVSNAILIAFLFPITLFGQSKWIENDDMYFSKKDREKVYASTSSVEHSNTEQSDYAANHNFNSPTMQSASAGSPTVQMNGNAEDANNQYFIKDYSLPKDKTYESVPINTYGNMQSFNNRPNVNVGFGMGYGFGSPYFGNSFNRFNNPYNDPFSPYYDPFFSYNDPWNSFGYDPWGYNRFGSFGNNRFGSWGNNRFGINRYYNSANWCPTNGYTNYSSNVRNEVRYRNGRKVISGSRGSATRRSSSNLASSGRPVKPTGAAVGTNGRSSNKRGTRNSYRKYPNSAQNRSSVNSNSGTKRANTYNRTNRNSNSNNLSNNSNSNRSNSNRSNSNRSNSYRSSGSSSGSRSSNFSRPSSGGGSRSSGSRPSSGSRSSGGRKR